MTSFDRRSFLQRSTTILSGITLLPTLTGKIAWGKKGAQTTATGKPTQFAEGTVYHDRNANGVRDSDEEGIKGVCVSNGREIVRTDAQGKYRLPVDDDTTLFVIKPSGWVSPRDANNLPKHYYHHKPNGSPKLRFPGIAPTGPLPASVDFPLRKQNEPDKFRVLLFGDTQPRDQKEIDYIAHDVVEELIGIDAAFGLTLGDELFDDLSLYDSLVQTVGTIGLPWYNVVGNHDMNYDALDDTYSTETFKRVYGPNYYAFDYGKVHFLVLDNVVWEGAEKKGYHGELGEKQLTFIKNDLAFVPKDRLVVVSMHIPVWGVQDHEALFRLLEDRPHTLSLSAHTHVQEHRFLGAADGWKGKTPHHHLNHATVCGSWWSGAPDERGIPHTTMSDGAPNGYSFLEFDGSRYKIEFKAAHRAATDQMGIFLPEAIPSAETGSTNVLVNVYAGSERSTVEMRLGRNGAWAPLSLKPQEDPYYKILKDLEASPKPPLGRALPEASKTAHLWSAPLPANLPRGVQVVQLRTTDMFGKTFTAERILRVV
jgi:hypothetical protein